MFHAVLCCVVHFDKMYDRNPSFDIILHHGGFFTIKDKLRVYLGGQECFMKKNDPDKWSIFELPDRKSTRLNSSHKTVSRMPSSA